MQHEQNMEILHGFIYLFIYLTEHFRTGLRVLKEGDGETGIIFYIVELFLL